MADEGVRKHCTKVAESLNHFTCNYCGVTTRGGGMTSMKLHLSGNDPKKNVKRCEKCPLEVREYMRLCNMRCALPRFQLDEGKVGKDSKQAMSYGHRGRKMGDTTLLPITRGNLLPEFHVSIQSEHRDKARACHCRD